MSNSISFVGRLGRDSEIKKFSDKDVLTFTVASDVGYGENKTTNWFQISYWQKADKLVDMLKKGCQVWVVGELAQKDFKSKEGETKTAMNIRATAIQLIGPKGKDEDGMDHKGVGASGKKPAAAKAAKVEDEGDSLPF